MKSTCLCNLLFKYAEIPYTKVQVPHVAHKVFEELVV